MSIEIKVPVLPESVSDATIASWHKKVGEHLKRDERLLDIETDKVVLEVVAPKDGYLENILRKEGDSVKAQEVVGLFKEAAENSSAPAEAPSKISTDKTENLSPSVRRIIKEENLNIEGVQGSGKKGRITKEDVKKEPAPLTSSALSSETVGVPTSNGERLEKRVPMSRLRARIAERLLQVQQSAAILTTFNEINMQPVMQLRQKYKETFEKDYGVRLGFMSFFTIAVIEALKRFPVVNASIDGNDIIYHGYYDIGVAVSSPRGLVVPIIRNAENLDMANIEKQISLLGEKAKNGELTMEEITGGTFTISNGGVFGSLMSTPILNPPQSAILGMHKIEERPVVENGEIVIRPMMYVALSYDHRIIDGAESVRFLVTIKELLEDPARLLLNV
jgi:2-oxoglutarate dehydrogenase E2 component (dihydrolipoamide succinyltransferase)